MTSDAGPEPVDSFLPGIATRMRRAFRKEGDTQHSFNMQFMIDFCDQ